MNNKGFTLVELIAIVLILAAIFMVGFPLFLNSTKKSKDTEYNAMVKNICLAGETYIYSNIDSFPEVSTIGNTIKLNVVNLIRYGNVKSNIINSKTGGSIKQDAVYYTVLEDSSLKCEYKQNLAQYVDNSGANLPELSGLTPVIYENNSWVVADVTKKWYDYENHEWANAVILTETGKSKQEGDSLNLDTDVKAMFVWIPRYEYKIEGEYGKAGTSATNPGEIEVNFVNRKSKKATKDYHIHPAFTFEDEELNGIWVGKFETTGTGDAPTVLPGVSTLTDQNVSTQFATAQKFNSYISNADSHMMKNSEWGAVAYLSQSKYGKYGNTSYEGTNKEIYQNKSSSYTTGMSNGTPSQDTTTNPQYTYNIELNGTGASTTGTIYGIYDMSGGAFENMMGNYGGITYSSGFEPTFFTNNKKYYDLYSTNSNGTTDETMGHALGETSGWYEDEFNVSTTWVVRSGGYNSNSEAGIFFVSSGSGDDTSGDHSFRVVIAPLSIN